MEKPELINELALSAIHFYRNHLSSLKGYKCAHAQLNGGMTCSGYALEAFGTHSFSDAVSRLQLRFMECNHSSAILRDLRPGMQPSCCGCSC